MKPSSLYRTSVFDKEFKFQYVRGDIHIRIATQDIILTFLWKWHFAWQCKYGSFKDESCTIGYISQLNRNWRAHNRAAAFNGFELYHI